MKVGHKNPECNMHLEASIVVLDLIEKLCSWKHKDNEKIVIPLSWYNNSCYMDSTFVALFANKTQYTDKLMNNHSSYMEEIKKIVNTIRGQKESYSCNNLRNLFSLSNSIPIRSFSETKEQDPSHFLDSFISEITMDDKIINKIKYNFALGSKTDFSLNQNLNLLSSLIKEEKKQEDSITLDFMFKNTYRDGSISYEIRDTPMIDHTLTKETTQGMTTSQLLNTKFDLGSRIIEEPYYMSYIILRLNRKAADDVINTNIIPDRFLRLDSGQILYLTSIMIYKDKHYVCYFFFEGSWWYYDDLGASLKFFGEYEKIFVGEGKNLIETGATQYYYVPY